MFCRLYRPLVQYLYLRFPLKLPRMLTFYYLGHSFIQMAAFKLLDNESQALGHKPIGFF